MKTNSFKRMCLFLNMFLFFSSMLDTSLVFAYNRASDSPYQSYTGGHEEITKLAIDSLEYPSLLKSDLTKFRDNLMGAVSSEDDGTSSRKHFYSGLWGVFQPATLYGDGLYEDAKKDYQKGNRAVAWNKVGRVLHLVQDMTSPSHANDASHLWHFYHKTGYEWWVTFGWGKYLEPYLNDVFSYPASKYISPSGNAWAHIANTAILTRAGGYAFDKDGATESSRIVVDASTSYDNARTLVPMAIWASGSLFKRHLSTNTSKPEDYRVRSLLLTFAFHNSFSAFSRFISVNQEY